MLTLQIYENYLKKIVSIFELFTYTISIIIIATSIIHSFFIYYHDYNNPLKMFDDIRLTLGESISLSLSYILSVEILKIFYIKTYKQLTIVVTVCLLKIIINNYLLNEIKDATKEATK